MSDQVFSHSGDIGDLIAALTCVASLGGGRLVLCPQGCTGWRMTPERAESLRPLLECQPYVTGVEWNERPEGTNLDDWRAHYRNHLNLADMVCSAFGQPHWPRERPWLFVPEARRVARVVFHRSQRWHNPPVVESWRRAWEEYRLDAVFVGLPEEHADFTVAVGPLPYYRTPTFLDLAEAMAGAELVCGNQSSPMWVALALCAPTVQEVCPWCPNAHFQRAYAEYSTAAAAGVPPLADLAGRWERNLARRAEDRTALTEDRLAVLAREARAAARRPGDLAELGVWRGGSAKVIAGACPGKPLHLFDTFSGNPADEALAGVHRRGEWAADRAEVEAFLAGHRVRLHAGLFPGTAAGLGESRFALVHVDADLYESTRDALEFFWPRLVPGGVMVFDDLGWKNCPGVDKALHERGLLDAVERAAPQQGVLRKPEGPVAAPIVLGPSRDPVALDLAHAALLAGAVASLKPARVLELGVGSGYTTRAVLQALAWNGRGELTCVDNWADWGGREPPHAQALRDAGAVLVTAGESDYLVRCPDDHFDVLVSDADHQQSDRWLDLHLRVVRDGGWLFFHDTANASFPNLGLVVRKVEALGLAHRHFTEGSRPDERCERGWLLVINRKAPGAPAPGDRPRVAVVSAWDREGAALAELTAPNKEAYCRRHGYTWRPAELFEESVEHGPAFCWAKIGAIREALGGADWVCWMDADLLIMDQTRPLSDFLSPGVDLVASHDVNGMNNGVLFWRDSPWTRGMLDRWEAARPRFAHYVNPEQSALVHLLYREPKERWAVVPQRLFNSYLYDLYPAYDCPEGNYAPGDFILHLPALPNDRRLEILREYLPRVQG
jgi:predicted O-methyltransferase YrrM